MGFGRRLLNSFRRERLHADAGEELAFHLEQRAQENRERGMMPDAAASAAKRQLGSLGRNAEEAADADLLTWLDSCRRDFQFSLRTLRRAPVLASMAILSLALGIGANTMVFTILKHLVLDSLPVPNADRLVLMLNPGPLEGHTSDEGLVKSIFSYPLYRDLDRTTSAVFDGILARSVTSVTLTQHEKGERARCELASGNYFNVLGVQPWRGRLLQPGDADKPGSHAVVVLSYGSWQRSFGGDEHIVGRTVHLNTQPYLVVGIAPPHFYGVRMDAAPDVFVPITMSDQLMPSERNLLDRLNHWLVLVARLKPGVSIGRAKSYVNTLYPGLHDQDLQFLESTNEAFLREFRKSKLDLSPGGKGYSGMRQSLSNPLRFLTVMVAIVLLITIVNVANLLIARGVARQREMAVRLSVGAGKGSIIRQLLIESITIGVAGGGLGICLAYFATPLLLRFLSSQLSESSLNAHPDGFVLALTAAVSLGAGLLFGLLPALTSARTDVAEAMRGAGATNHTGSRLWLRRVLVCGQIGFSLLLLTGAMLFSTSLRNLQNVNPGFDVSHLLTFKVDPQAGGYSQVRIQNFAEQIRAKLSQLPGVQSVGVSQEAVLEGDDWGRNITVPGYRPPKRGDSDVLMNVVSPQFLETLRIPLRSGRSFRDTDLGANKYVAVINTAAANKFFARQSPIGRQFQLGGGGKNQAYWTIIGVVADSEQDDLRSEIQPFFYFPYYSLDIRSLTFYIRSSGGEKMLAEQVRGAVQQTDPALPIYGLKTVQELINENLFAERGLATLSLLFAGLAVVLSIIGLYGVVAYSVSQRRREFGIRMAIGADASNVLGIVLKETALLGVASVACALPFVFGSAHLIRSSLYGVSPTDPFICGGAVLLLLTVAIAAGLVPASSAARIDPHDALRAE